MNYVTLGKWHPFWTSAFSRMMVRDENLIPCCDPHCHDSIRCNTENVYHGAQCMVYVQWIQAIFKIMMTNNHSSSGNNPHISLIGIQSQCVDECWEMFRKIAWGHMQWFLNAQMRILDFIPLAMISHRRISGFQKDNSNIKYRRYWREDTVEMKRHHSFIHSFCQSSDNYRAPTCQALVGENAEKDR